MKLRSEIQKEVNQAKQLTTRQMEFIENIRQKKLEELRIKKSSIDSDDRVKISITICTTVGWLIICLLVLCLNIVLSNRDIKAFELGYTKQPKLGSTTTYWEKTDESNKDKKHYGKDRDNQSSSIYTTPAGRDSLRNTSEEIE